MFFVVVVVVVVVFKRIEKSAPLSFLSYHNYEKNSHDEPVK
jgi:hypothetical protein